MLRRRAHCCCWFFVCVILIKVNTPIRGRSRSIAWGTLQCCLVYISCFFLFFVLLKNKNATDWKCCECVVHWSGRRTIYVHVWVIQLTLIWSKDLVYNYSLLIIRCRIIKENHAEISGSIRSVTFCNFLYENISPILSLPSHEALQWQI